MKSACFDIETTALEGVGAGILICVCVRPFDTQRTRTFRIDQYRYEPDPLFGVFDRQEKDLLVAVLEELNKYDLLVGHNIENFDLGFLRTRAQRHNIPFYMNPITYDTMKGFRRVKWRTVMNAIGKPSASMDMVADFLGLDQLKTKIYPVEWWQSIWGNEVEKSDAMNKIVDHCERDVRMNTEIYDILIKHDMKVSLKRWM